MPHLKDIYRIFAKYALHKFRIVADGTVRQKYLDGPGKTTAMYPAGSGIDLFQVDFCQCKTQCHTLFPAAIG